MICYQNVVNYEIREPQQFIGARVESIVKWLQSPSFRDSTNSNKSEANNRQRENNQQHGYYNKKLSSTWWEPRAKRQKVKKTSQTFTSTSCYWLRWNYFKKITKQQKSSQKSNVLPCLGLMCQWHTNHTYPQGQLFLFSHSQIQFYLLH